jgi:guanine nucleotide-binding protein G(i) subunit alpha
MAGSVESGESTIIRHMKINHQGFTKEELLAYRPAIYRDVLESAKAIVNAMRILEFDCVYPANRVRWLLSFSPPDVWQADLRGLAKASRR